MELYWVLEFMPGICPRGDYMSESSTNRFDVLIAAIEAATKLIELRPSPEQGSTIQKKWVNIFNEIWKNVGKTQNTNMSATK